MRAMMASNRFSLMELGISPIVTSGMIMQVLQSIGLIEVNLDNPKDRALFNAAQKFFGIIFTMVLSTFYVLSGMYGPVAELGLIRCLVIIIQLVSTGFILLLLDDLINKGWGLGNGTSLFIAAGICEQIFWKAFSPRSVSAYPGPDQQFEGAILALFHLLASESLPNALYIAFFRQGAANLTSLVSTIIVFLIVAYFQGIRVDINLKSKFQRVPLRPYSIKLFYTSNMPIIIMSAIVSNFFLISQLLAKSRFGKTLPVRLLGVWQRFGGSSLPVGGIAYYMSPPVSLREFFGDPLHTILYLVFVLSVTAFFSYTWVPLSGQSAKDIDRQFKSQNIIVPGHTRSGSVEAYLARYIDIASKFGGMCIGALSVTADFLGAIGSGTGILLATTTINQMWDSIIKEGGEENLQFLSIAS